ncbi:MAG TPA: CpsD/CapB family tyrosine-protein kinase [Candidatus Dormibacteraeota bacterium]|nr:CpsD/CapB family tyrosine-protein kinase [Candidatus Dormibacteraeota bacterium]
MSRNFDMLNEAAPQIGVAPTAKARNAEATGVDAAQVQSGAVNEEIARLVQRVFLSAPLTESSKVVAFCGVDRRAGCSWICARAAEFLTTQTPARVCIVDANLRDPSLHQHFRSKLSPGFAEAIRSTAPIDNFVRTTRTDRLWLMTAGEVSEDPNGVLSAGRLQTRFGDLREEFDFLLIDVPAIGASREALLIGQLSDGIILVVASNATRREPARVAKQNCDEAKIPILGAVLNKRTYPIPEALYRRL